MNRFSINLVRGITAGIAYVLSILCFLNTNVYKSMLASINSVIVTLVVANIPVILFVIIALLSRKDLSNAVLGGSIFLLLPGIISVSKFDWVFEMKAKSSVHPALLAVSCYMVLIMLILGKMVNKFDSHVDRLYKHGADESELEIVQKKQYSVYMGAVLAVTLPVSVTAVIGFFIMQPKKAGSESIIFLLAGIVIAALSVWICISGLNKKR